MQPSCAHSGLWCLVATCVVLWPGPSEASGRHRTPAEIEMRRSEIAARLAVVAEEEVALTNRLAEADAALESARAGLAARLQHLIEERDALRVEASELAGQVTRTATGPLTSADPRGLTPAQIAGGSAQASAGTAFNPAITVIPDGLYYYDTVHGDANTQGSVRWFATRRRAARPLLPTAANSRRPTAPQTSQQGPG